MKETPLKLDNILVNQTSVDKDVAIRQVGQHLVDQGYAQPAYIQSMLNRDAHLTTYLGNHIAIPHGEEGSSALVNKTGVVIHHYPAGIDFGDEQAFLIIGIAAKDTEHLEILSNIAVIFSDIDQVEALFKNPVTPQILFDLLHAEVE